MKNHAAKLSLGTLTALAWRNLWRNRRRTLITVSTIAIGFALGVISIGLGDGGHNQMIRNGIRMGAGHLTIQPEGYLAEPSNGLFLPHGEDIAAHPALAAADARIAPRIFLQVLAATAHNSSGVGLQGIDPARDPLAEDLRGSLVKGRWPKPSERNGVVVGKKLAKKLKLRVGSKLVLMAGGDDGAVTNRLARVRGIFDSGLAQLDEFLVLSGLEFARQLLPGYRPGSDGRAVTRLAIFLRDPDRLPALMAELKAQPPPPGAAVHDWWEMMPELVNFIILDDAGNYVFLSILLVLVVFGIVNTILMAVLERTREFGLVRALGLRPGHLVALVLLETMLLALVALAAGWALGGAAHAYLALVGLDLSSFSQEALTTAGVMMDPVMKSELSLGRVLLLSGVAFGTTMASGCYPAIKAARVPPVAALRT
ncbi:MAG: FtsX-like permease family protein [bacterium]